MTSDQSSAAGSPAGADGVRGGGSAAALPTTPPHDCVAPLASRGRYYCCVTARAASIESARSALHAARFRRTARAIVPADDLEAVLALLPPEPAAEPVAYAIIVSPDPYAGAAGVAKIAGHRVVFAAERRTRYVVGKAEGGWWWSIDGDVQGDSIPWSGPPDALLLWALLESDLCWIEGAAAEDEVRTELEARYGGGS